MQVEDEPNIQMLMSISFQQNIFQIHDVKEASTPMENKYNQQCSRLLLTILKSCWMWILVIAATLNMDSMFITPV